MSIFPQISPAATKLTYTEYALFPDDGKRHEILDGRHYMNPAPSPQHQTVSRHLQFQLYQQIEVPGLGQVFNAPLDLQLSDHDVVQPDLVVVMRQNQIITPSRIKGVPDLVVEILSPSNRAYDQQLKRRLYDQAGVPEYWIVDPEKQTVQQLKRTAGPSFESPTVCTQQITFQCSTCRATVDLQRIWS